jgi:hypothetical protein
MELVSWVTNIRFRVVVEALLEKQVVDLMPFVVFHLEYPPQSLRFGAHYLNETTRRPSDLRKLTNRSLPPSLIRRLP